MIRRAAALAAALLCAACDSESLSEPIVEQDGCERIEASALELPAPPALLQARRTAFAQAVRDGVLVVGSGSLDSNATDNGYRGDSNLFYLAGIDIPGASLVLHVRTGAVDSTILFLPQQATSSSHPVVARDVTGASAVRCTSGVSPTVRRFITAQARPLLYLTGNRATTDTTIVALRAQGYTGADVSALLAQLRLVKDTAEIARLRRAAEITAQAIRGAATSIRAPGNERAVATAIESGFVARGASGPSFPSIVAAGESALTLHYNANNRALAGNELILVDVGAEFARYAGDVTRTYPVAGTFTARQRALYELVLGAQLAAIEAIRPGATPAQLESISRAYLRNNSNGLCGTRTCDTFFVHSLWHWIGLNVHDVGSRQATLQPGMVLTIEPGIYLPTENIGIRIEDDVLVTATGYEILSQGAPKTVAEIEALFAAHTAFLTARY